MTHDLDLLLATLVNTRGAVAADEHRIVQYVRKRLAADEASYWRIEPEGDKRAARRTAGCEAANNEPLHPLALNAEECATYFAATHSTGLLISRDPLHDDRLAGAREKYLVPDDVQALLCVAVTVNAQPVAVISCAQRGRLRHWSASDVAVMQQLSNGLAVRYGRGQSLHIGHCHGAPTPCFWC